MVANKHVLIGVGGGIAAYKACEVVSSLAKAGAEVRVILTDRAQAFITPLTLATLSRNPAYTDQLFWQPQPRPLHIELGEWADLMLIAPLTANTLAKLTYGFADNLLTNTVLASTCPILLAPAMNTDMWEQPTVQHNWQQLQTQSRYHWIDPGAGILACDRVGTGRMAEPSDILTHLQSLLHTQGQRDFQGQRFLISAGSTHEHLDPVRFIGNPATGKMGFALAQAALHRGAQVTVVHGPLSGAPLSGAPSPGLQTVAVTSAAQMQQAMQENFPQADWIIMAAAVADVKPAHTSLEKLPKQALPQTLALEFVPDIVSDLSTLKRPEQRLIGFAAQTGDIVTPAWEKLHKKRLDAIVTNAIDQPNSGFGSDFNQVVILDAQGRQQKIPLSSKLEVAHHILDFIKDLRDGSPKS